MRICLECPGLTPSGSSVSVSVLMNGWMNEQMKELRNEKQSCSQAPLTHTTVSNGIPRVEPNMAVLCLLQEGSWPHKPTGFASDRCHLLWVQESGMSMNLGVGLRRLGLQLC